MGWGGVRGCDKRSVGASTDASDSSSNSSSRSTISSSSSSPKPVCVSGSSSASSFFLEPFPRPRPPLPRPLARPRPVGASPVPFLPVVSFGKPCFKNFTASFAAETSLTSFSWVSLSNGGFPLAGLCPSDVVKGNGSSRTVLLLLSTLESFLGKGDGDGVEAGIAGRGIAGGVWQEEGLSVIMALKS